MKKGCVRVLSCEEGVCEGVELCKRGVCGVGVEVWRRGV